MIRDLQCHLSIRLTDAILLEFPQTSVSDERAAITRKCNNEHFSQKKSEHVLCVFLYGGKD